MDYKLTHIESCIYEALIKLSDKRSLIDLDILTVEIKELDLTEYDIRLGIASMRRKGVFDYDPDASLIDWVDF